MKLDLPALLSLNGGYVDAAGFLALHGLFTSHVTGNFVTLGASVVLGTSGVLAKVLALPTFCVIVVLATLASRGISSRGGPTVRILLAVELLLLIIAGALAVRFGPFADGDHGTALLTGMTLVTAMAIQNAVQRIHYGSLPPTTIMTGTTTQMMIDLADVMRGLPPDAAVAAKGRLRRMAANVAGFGVGCALAAFAFSSVHMLCFVVPPCVVIVTLIARTAGRGAKAT